MKLFVTSDIHGNMNLIYKIRDFINSRQDIDCIVLCGDIAADQSCTSFSELEEKQFSEYLQIQQIFNKTNRKLLFILGNHDVFHVRQEDICYIPQNNSEEFENFVALEYINFFMYGTKREGNEEEMKHRLSKLKVHRQSIIVSHLPSYKCLDKANNNKHYGSRAILEMINEKKPAYFLCGHVHDSFGYKKLNCTHVINAACDDKKARGWVIDLTLEKFEKIVL